MTTRREMLIAFGALAVPLAGVTIPPAVLFRADQVIE